MEESTSTQPDQASPGDSTDTGPAGGTTTMPPPPRFDPQPVRRLYRTKGPISGVAAGLADYFNLDASLVRVGLAAGTLLGGPIVPIGYIAAWIIIPQVDPAPVAPLVAPPFESAGPNPVPPTAVPFDDAPAPSDGNRSPVNDAPAPADGDPSPFIDPPAPADGTPGNG